MEEEEEGKDDYRSSLVVVVDNRSGRVVVVDNRSASAEKFESYTSIFFRKTSFVFISK